MRHAVRLTVIAGIALVVRFPAGSAAADPPDRMWFSPGPGTLDYRRLFENPDEWARARSVVNVFKFYAQHTQTPAPSIVGPNTYDALVRAGAFRKLTSRRKRRAGGAPGSRTNSMKSRPFKG